ncbi:zinc finger protein 184-like [Wyeomyia smithii]|uniref:zinc finger protein 184-like n=1 Tax=Wyeomyia smithii TaxID=174621 RepID=UPI002467C774|nr:zinc finger protein 184-like [Wyeomyia smithii]
MERICRLCLQDGPNLGPVEHYAVDRANQNDTEPQDFSQLIFRYLSIQVIKREHNWDTAICSNCRSAILDWHKFRECCLRNDQIYVKLLSEVSQSPVDQELLKGLNPSEHVMRTDEPKEKEVNENFRETIDNENLNLSPIDFCEVNLEEQRSSASFDNDQGDKFIKESKKPNKKHRRPQKERANQNSHIQQSDASEVGKTKKKRKSKTRAAVCPICGKIIKNFSGHIKTHSNVIRKQCPFCPKAFVTTSNYSAHVNIHTRAKLYKCDLCDKQYALLNGLKQHRKTHFKEREYLCHVCDKSFYQQTGLSRHKKTHLEEKPFACEICSRTFGRRDHLVTHMKTHRLNTEQGDATVLKRNVPTSDEQAAVAEGLN